MKGHTVVPRVRAQPRAVRARRSTAATTSELGAHVGTSYPHTTPSGSRRHHRSGHFGRPGQRAFAGRPGGREAAASSVTVTPDPSYSQEKFEGWGTSLVWFANATGDYPPAVRDKLANLLFGDDGLTLNIARYNIGGGNAPDVKDYLRAGGAVEGWWKAPAGTTRDGHRLVERRTTRPTGTRTPTPTQRWWVDRIKKDITHWETFSNSPPWFMTESGYVSGGFDANTDQLKADSVDDFAAYLAGVDEAAGEGRTASRSTPSTRSTSPTPTTGAPSWARTACPRAAGRRAPTSAPRSSRRCSPRWRRR